MAPQCCAADNQDPRAGLAPGYRFQGACAREQNAVRRYLQVPLPELSFQLAGRMFGIVGDNHETVLEQAEQRIRFGKQLPAAHECAVEVDEIPLGC